MDAYMQHLKSLREYMNDHEDKVAFLSAEQSEQETLISHLERDLESVCADSDRVKDEVDSFNTESGRISKLIMSCQKKIGILDTDNHALSQAWELLDEKLRMLSSRMLEKRLNYERLEADALSLLDQYQAHYESRPLKQEFKELDAKSGKAAESAPVNAAVEEKANQEAIVNDVEMVECGDDRDESKLTDAQSRLRQIREEIKQAEEQLKGIDIENAQLEAEGRDFEEDLRALTDEKFSEKEFIQSLNDRLEQLQEYSQDVVCGSCTHAYVIQFSDSKFVVHERGDEKQSMVT